MKLFRIRPGFTIFILFFGISLLEAFRTRNWINVAFWVGIGLVFLIADNLKGENIQKEETE